LNALVYINYALKVKLKSHAAWYRLMAEGYTNIRLSFETRDRLKKRGSKGEDYDHIIIRLLDATETQIKTD
jgi:hypothetical protein